jgi:hypothetical protein
MSQEPATTDGESIRQLVVAYPAIADLTEPPRSTRVLPFWLTALVIILPAALTAACYGYAREWAIQTRGIFRPYSDVPDTFLVFCWGVTARSGLLKDG